MDFSTQKSTGRENDARSQEAQAHLRHDARYFAVVYNQVIYSLLENLEILLIFKNASDSRLVQGSVCLSSGGADGRPFAAVQYSELYACPVSRSCHGTAKSVDLLDQMSLANAANGWIAGHLAQGFNIVGNQQSTNAHTGSSQCCFGAGMTATHHDDVVFF